MTGAIKKAAKSMWKMTPLIFGTMLLIALINALVPNSFYARLFTKNNLIDPIIGASAGSISAGNPVISYILSGELLKSGISLIAVTAFLLAWVTVGIIQMPAEMGALGKKFTILRNSSSFVLAIIIAILIGFLQNG